LIAEKLSKDGGLERYQQASQIGQLNARGGDTSKVLISWLEESTALKPFTIALSKTNGKIEKMRVLEIGCLSPENAISNCKAFEIVRIDLHSTHPSIEEQDFMQRPLPRSDDEKFDIVSLSLVLNFVPDASQRGEMLFRTTKFLHSVPPITYGLLENAGASNINRTLPALFFTLPLPCVTNSRYMTEQHLAGLMSTLGYAMTYSKSSAKIFYSLWKFDPLTVRRAEVKKKEIASGKGRNNFCVVLEGK
jgi:25S rRNA (adenine2142-N1)-methyltransferase